MRPKNASAQTTRDELLRAASDALDETGFDTTVHLRLTDVTRRAGRTTGAAYQLWPRQHQFHRNLAEAALEREIEAPLVGLGTSSTDALAALVAGQLADPRYRTLIHYWAAAQTDTSLGAALASAFERYDATRRSAIAVWLSRAGREPLPPRTAAEVACMIGALVDGLTLRAGMGSSADADVVTSAVQAVLNALTRPVRADG